MKHVIGIDAGGTKTVCLLADACGTVLAEARTEGANLASSGEEEFARVIGNAIRQLEEHGPVDPAAICLGIAGVDQDEHVAIVRGIVRRLGFDIPTVVVNDALLALVAGAGHDAGIVLIAGTGSIAFGRNARGQAARAGGWGYIMSDEGSAYWIGRRALQAIMRAVDGRSPGTALTALVLEHFAIGHPRELVQTVYYGGLRPPGIAALAPLVGESAKAGDAAARKILDDAAGELLLAARTVMARLELDREAFAFVLAGGLFQAVPWLAERLAERAHVAAPTARITRLEREPAMGAIVLALDALRGDVRLPSYD